MSKYGRARQATDGLKVLDNRSLGERDRVSCSTASLGNWRQPFEDSAAVPSSVVECVSQFVLRTKLYGRNKMEEEHKIGGTFGTKGTEQRTGGEN